MPPLNIYPSFAALYVADELFAEMGERIVGFRGRIGVAWYWKIGRAAIVEFQLRYSRTEARWDTILGQATSAAAGPFAELVLPLMAYSSDESSHAYIHDANGAAHWANRRLLARDVLVSDMVEWLVILGGRAPKPSGMKKVKGRVVK